jgi:HD-like signal output (HDOD) protein
MNRIMFVDDDQNILQGIRRMLRPMRQEWNLTFANSGNEALDILKEELYDAIVSDTRMPGMNGIELLNEVRELYPNVIRIGLSGHTDNDLALESTKTTHQQLVKPCESEALKNTINKALQMRLQVKNDSLNQFITKTDSLPPLPKLYREITEVMQTENGSLADVASIISKDIAMTAKILQLVNSAFFGLTRHVESTQEAVMYLGYDVIRGLVLTIKLFSELELANQSGLDLEELWTRSFSIGSIAKHIAMVSGMDNKSQDYAHMAGMLHDVGILVMAMSMPDEYSEVIKIKLEEKTSTCIIEERIFGCTHAEVGGALLGIWGLPDPIVDAVTNHHTPSHSTYNIISPVTAVHLANIYYWQNIQADYPIPIDTAYIETLDLKEKAHKWNQSIKEIFFKDESN